MKSNIFEIIGIILFVTGLNMCLSAQDTGSVKDETKAVKTEAIFDNIMKTLPTSLKARVDSAAQKQVQSSSQNRIPTHSVQAGTGKSELESSLSDLPEELRVRVKKAMEEIEAEGKKQPSPQFRFRKKQGKE